MSDLIHRAMRFAKETHQRIDQRRKYSNQPYAVHLEKVAKIVASITDDEEMIAAAWLHDVVEDTPATLDDIGKEFGSSIARMVQELTDISRPTDGNRAVRKAIDRAHLAGASGRSQTIKLADLIDNCKDISRHDPRFAAVYLNEMKALLAVLTGADEKLMRRARQAMADGFASIEKLHAIANNAAVPPSEDAELERRFKRQYNDIFRAQDIAEPLLSFDTGMPAAEVKESLERQHQPLAAVRVDGEVTGFIASERLGPEGSCGGFSQAFAPDQVISGDAGFAEVIHVLTRHAYCFLSILGKTQGVILRHDVNKPYMRMWLFGIITLTEMQLTESIKSRFKQGEWQHLLSEARLKAARDLQLERKRLNQHVELIDCLQLADKGLLLINHPELLPMFEFSSKNAAKKVVRQFQSLRNNLAHGQDISTYDWAQIARFSIRMLE